MNNTVARGARGGRDFARQSYSETFRHLFRESAYYVRSKAVSGKDLARDGGKKGRLCRPSAFLYFLRMLFHAIFRLDFGRRWSLEWYWVGLGISKMFCVKEFGKNLIFVNLGLFSCMKTFLADYLFVADF